MKCIKKIFTLQTNFFDKNKYKLIDELNYYVFGQRQFN